MADMTGTREEVGVGIKKVLLGVGEARQERGNVAGRFAEVMVRVMESARD